MVIRIARILPAVVVVVLLGDVRPAVSEGWSLPNPFSSSPKTDAKKKSAPSITKKEPSAWDKFSTGTKNLFTKPAETLGLKKTEAKKPQYATVQPRVIQTPAKKQESKPWFGFPSKEEPKREKTVSEWMERPRLDP